MTVSSTLNSVSCDHFLYLLVSVPVLVPRTVSVQEVLLKSMNPHRLFQIQFQGFLGPNQRLPSTNYSLGLATNLCYR
ncbi:unnamed protein product [Protopolystoma xenopodis]|uniref:Uncharacterized protein n=1 Tax=Protopolystoma xenopodis TaxID=117903 RepID=A0A448XJN0_9PLAT|nr:unnamed protein product [Protopolystoma xenopodis]